jgi:ATP-dependent Clp protease ATP-binding subunit ClpB
VHFHNTVIIMTSNLGSGWILSPDESPDSMYEKVMATVQGHFKPEFLNRVDELIVFHRLSEADLERIVAIQLESLRDRLAERKITLEVDEEAMRYVARKGFDPAYGARPLKRLIQREIANELAVKVLDGTIRDGDAVRVELTGDGLAFRTEEPEAA